MDVLEPASEGRGELGVGVLERGEAGRFTPADGERSGGAVLVREGDGEGE
jgi:hypothetical protein